MTRYVTEANTFMEPEIMTRLSVVLRAENLNPEDPLFDSMNLRSRQTRAFLAGLIRSAQDRGEYRSEINADVKAAEILAFLVGLETQWVAEKSAIDLEPVFGRSSNLC